MQTWSSLYLYLYLFHLFSHQIFIMSMPNGNFSKPLPLMTLSSLLQALVANMQFGRDLSPPWADAALLKASKPNLRKKSIFHMIIKCFFSAIFPSSSPFQSVVCEIVRSTDWKCQHLGRTNCTVSQNNSILQPLDNCDSAEKKYTFKEI